MSWIECLLMFAGISLDMFAAMEIQGAKIAKVRKKVLFSITFLVILLQILFFYGGYFVGYEITKHVIGSGEGLRAGHVMAALIFISLGVRMLVKAIKHDFVFEHRSELTVKDYVKIITVTMVFTLFAGFATGLVGVNVWAMLIIIAAISFVVVIGGMYAGYNLGFTGKTPMYAAGGSILMLIGIEMIIRVNL